MEFFRGRVSWGDLIVEYCCWFYYCTWLEKYGSNDFETEKTWKNIMSLKKNVCLRSGKTFLGTEKKLGDLTVSRCSQPIPRMLVVGNVVT